MMLFSKRELPTIKGYTSNSELQTIIPNYAGTPLDQNGKFINEEFPTIISYIEIFKFLREPNPQKQEKKNDDWRISVLKNERGVRGEFHFSIFFASNSFLFNLQRCQS